MGNFIEENNKKKITRCFILYVDEECKKSKSEKVCNFQCLHCYYRFSHQRWRKLSVLKKEIEKRIMLGADHIQITGAEPTMYKDIFALIDFIKSKKVLCSVITNGYLLSIENLVKKYVGKVDYFLMSIHGHQDKWDEIAQMPGAWGKTIRALENCLKYNLEVHFNTTVLKQNYQELDHIVKLAIQYQVKRCNFICFNPFCSLKKPLGQKLIKELIVSYDDMMPYLEKACTVCQSADISIALRYFPLCKVKKELRRYIFNYSTLIFDRNEWNYLYWFWDHFIQNIEGLKTFSRFIGLEGDEEQKLQHAFGRTFSLFRKNFTELENCKSCPDYLICDTPHTEQVKLFPHQKFSGTELPIKKNAKYYLDPSLQTST